VVERRHRQRARVEDRIREDKDTGLAKLQFREFVLNEVWLEIVLLAHDLIIWTQTLLLEGELAVAFHRLKARRRPTHQPSRSSPAAGAGRQAQTIAARREPKPRQRQREGRPKQATPRASSPVATPAPPKARSQSLLRDYCTIGASASGNEPISASCRRWRSGTRERWPTDWPRH
jgi:hypothetical protein